MPRNFSFTLIYVLALLGVAMSTSFSNTTHHTSTTCLTCNTTVSTKTAPHSDKTGTATRTGATGTGQGVISTGAAATGGVGVWEGIGLGVVVLGGLLGV
ncbi:hypothetical protein GLAREA_07464 [Glarea lozoyensis ATCC 20868]|uniref:Uncharacterized protein n=1 Tax=Glarea lozoyensis (strain ATCC 20868 / MF5171) TaxID=1116229 RepID=S3DJW6_GLAL2|nr:uncharacterized protein GLAREA_07464 [Glarea lozoyensis ATCC 20868]EPE32331.1 hypothetical protein GLAREA_07464 [Glarea lozoyensis ATCC 20868]